MNASKIRSSSFDVVYCNREILSTIKNPESSFKWITVEDIIHVYEGLAADLEEQPLVLHQQLISDAVYEPIKDILFYGTTKSLFSRICEFTYLIGHAVGSCNIQLMITLFNALYRINYNAEEFFITNDLIKIFTRAYNKEIHLEAFEGFLAEIILTRRNEQ